MATFDPQIQLEFVSREAEALMLFRIGEMMRGKLAMPGEGRSRIIRFGWDYLSDKHLGEPPDWMPKVGDADSWTVNEYPIGHHIAPHIDSLRFADNIHVLSLGAETGMIFTPPVGAEIVRELPRRSLLTFGGELRRTWKHSTLPTAEGVRYSIVFRRKL